MADSLTATGGVLLGGEGTWGGERGSGCRLVVSRGGLLSTLKVLTDRWEAHWRYGLYQNDFKPHFAMVFADLVPCDYSGYSGEELCFSWAIPAMSGLFAISTAHDLEWPHNGGPVGNFVFGYYVRDPAGILVWAERFCPAPMGVDRLGQIVRVRPQFYLTNDLPD